MVARAPSQGAKKLATSPEARRKAEPVKSRGVLRLGRRVHRVTELGGFSAIPGPGDGSRTSLNPPRREGRAATKRGSSAGRRYARRRFVEQYPERRLLRMPPGWPSSPQVLPTSPELSR